MATADNGSGGTRLTVASTIAFVPWDQIIITDYWGIGSNILGTWPKLTKVDATHIDITVAYQAVNWAAGAQPLIGGLFG